MKGMKTIFIISCLALVASAYSSEDDEDSYEADEHESYRHPHHIHYEVVSHDGAYLHPYNPRVQQQMSPHVYNFIYSIQQKAFDMKQQTGGKPQVLNSHVVERNVQGRVRGNEVPVITQDVGHKRDIVGVSYIDEDNLPVTRYNTRVQTFTKNLEE